MQRALCSGSEASFNSPAVMAHRDRSSDSDTVQENERQGERAASSPGITHDATHAQKAAAHSEQLRAPCRGRNALLQRLRQAVKRGISNRKTGPFTLLFGGGGHTHEGSQ